MATRRTFLKAGLGVSAAGALIRPGSARVPAVPYYKAIFDERLAEARTFAAGARERGIKTAAIRGDITRLFFDDLDLRWKKGPVRLAGLTLPSSLFCLDLLARDRGMRVSYCSAADSEAALVLLDGAVPDNFEETSDSAAPVFWIIAPRFGADAPLSSTVRNR